MDLQINLHGEVILNTNTEKYLEARDEALEDLTHSGLYTPEALQHHAYQRVVVFLEGGVR